MAIQHSYVSQSEVRMLWRGWVDADWQQACYHGDSHKQCLTTTPDFFSFFIPSQSVSLQTLLAIKSWHVISSLKRRTQTGDERDCGKGQQSHLIPDPVMTWVDSWQLKQQQKDFVLPPFLFLPKLQRSRSMFNQDDLFSSEDK